MWIDDRTDAPCFANSVVWDQYAFSRLQTVLAGDAGKTDRRSVIRER